MSGAPSYASSIALGASVSPNDPQVKPFGVAVDLAGNAWITKNRSSTVTIFSPEGRVIKTIPSVYQGTTIITHPIGNAPDIEGNMWVATPDYLDAPCPTRKMLGTAKHGSITMFQMDTQEPYPGSPFTGGRAILLWGLTVDAPGQGVDLQLRLRPDWQGEPHSHCDQRQPLLRLEHDEVPGGAAYRRPDLAIDEIPQQCHYANNRRRGGSFGQALDGR
jgi:hypothetical protein